MKKIFTLNVIAIIVLASCGQHSGSDSKSMAAAYTAPKDWKTLDKSAYTLQYPADWILDTAAGTGVIFSISSPSSMTDTTFMSMIKINLATEDLAGKGADLDAYNKGALTEVKSLFPDMAVTENKKINGDAQGEHEKLLYTTTQGGKLLSIEQWYWIVKEKAYIVTFASLNASYDKNKEMAQNIMKTFVVKG
jgi:hypothetical protein